MRLERATYTVELSGDGHHATVFSPQGEHWLTLFLGAALDRVGSVDETLAFSAPEVDEDSLTVRRVSTAWREAGVTLVCGETSLELRTWVAGEGLLTDVHLLAGRLLVAAKAPGLHPSGSSFRTLFSPNPGDPSKLVRAATESAVLGTSGDGALGRGHWFFTPPPYWLAFAADEATAPEDATRGGWLGLGIVAPPAELGFVQAAYRPADHAFHLVLEYEGHTDVRGRFDAPALVLTPGARTAYDGLRAHRDELADRGAAPRVSTRARPGWWREPMFCGWGAQCALSAREGGAAPAYATQANYDSFLEALAAHDVVPGTVVVDDKWQRSYGLNDPDEAKWPDLAGWIRGRHEAGQRVLLWWKAWDAEGLPAELCIRSPTGTVLGLDPTNPAARRVLAEVMGRLVGADGLGADGLKIDFTGRTPSGHALAAQAAGWGTALLHELLSFVYAEVKKSNPEALVITHTPHPGFADVTDMIRLNDMLRLDDPGPLPVDAVVPQMRYRARVASAAMPDVLIDTDDWCVPDKRTWRAYLEEKPSLGVPSLYYATHLDLSGEALDDEDYAALRRVWTDWRRAG